MNRNFSWLNKSAQEKGSRYLLIAVCASIQLSATAHAATAGACTSSSSGSVTATGSNGYVATGTPSFNTNVSQPSGVCMTSGVATLGGSGTGGVPYGGISTQDGSSSSTTMSGGLLTLTGSGGTTIDGSTSGGTAGPLQQLGLSASGATTLQQTFALSSGEAVGYTLNLSLSGNTGVIGYAVGWSPNFSVTLGSASGTPATLVSASSEIENNDLPWSTTVAGELVNNTGSVELFTLTTTENYTGTSILGGSGNHPEEGNGALNFQYDMNVAPVPLPAAAWLMISSLGGLGVFAQKKKPRVPVN